jgi:hypothetical protein
VHWIYKCSIKQWGNVLGGFTTVSWKCHCRLYLRASWQLFLSHTDEKCFSLTKHTLWPSRTVLSSLLQYTAVQSTDKEHTASIFRVEQLAKQNVLPASRPFLRWLIFFLRWGWDWQWVHMVCRLRGLLYQTRMIVDDVCEAVGGMIGRGNRSK